jgi:hypothetical protein
MDQRERSGAVDLAIVVGSNLVAGLLCAIPVTFAAMLVVYGWFGVPSYEFGADDEMVSRFSLVFVLVAFGGVNALLQLAVVGWAARWWAVGLTAFMTPSFVIFLHG